MCACPLPRPDSQAHTLWLSGTRRCLPSLVRMVLPGARIAFPGGSDWGCWAHGKFTDRFTTGTLGVRSGLRWGGHANGTPCHIQHSPNTPTTGLRERGNDTSKSTGRSGRQKAATRRNMRREERVTVQGPVKEQQPDGMSHRGLYVKQRLSRRALGMDRGAGGHQQWSCTAALSDQS